MSVLVALLAAAAAALLPRGAAWRLGAVRDGAGAPRSHRVALAVVGALVAVWVAAALGLHLLMVTGAVVAAGAVVRRLAGIAVARRARATRQRVVIELCDALSAELRGGLPASLALEHACGGAADLGPIAAAARLGGDIPAAMRHCADAPGAAGLGALAACWEVAAGSGAALGSVLDRLGSALRAEQEARDEVAAALGPPRATARMLAVLPVFGLMLGGSMGADPVGFLLGSGWGIGCLSAGVGLALLGVWWVERLAEAAEV